MSEDRVIAAFGASKSAKLILASASPRRRALLHAMRIPFLPMISGVDESLIQAESPEQLAINTARAKAEAIATTLPAQDSGKLVLGADTVVVLDGRSLGKPEIRERAFEMLSALSGRTHEVITGIAFQEAPTGRKWESSESTLVTFSPLTPDQICNYVNSGEADDKAGAYGLQGLGGRFITDVRGELSNVIGLCLGQFRRGMIELTGEDPLRDRTEKEVVLAAFSDLPENLTRFLR